MYYFYVLRSKKDGKNYYGVTDNVERRLREHNEGKNISTKHRRPFFVMYTRAFVDKSSAYTYEWQVKHNGDTNKQLKNILAEVAKVVKARV